MSTLLLSLGRVGDIINVLPCVQKIAERERLKCSVMVCAPFADVLEGCSYAEPIIFDGHFTDLNGALYHAINNYRFGRVLIAKINERAIGVTTECGSFTEEAWRQLGALDAYDRWPLVFDRRDFTREAALLQRECPGGPFGLYNFTGKSSSLPQGEEWLARNAQFLPVKSFYNLGAIKAERIYDLLGLMDRAKLLITCDTATLHLAAASKVPCINFIQAKPTTWHGSKPRNNSILEMRYDAIRDLTEPLKI